MGLPDLVYNVDLLRKLKTTLFSKQKCFIGNGHKTAPHTATASHRNGEHQGPWGKLSLLLIFHDTDTLFSSQVTLGTKFRPQLSLASVKQ